MAFKRTKHILRHAYELRDRVLRRVYAPEYVDTASQLADILTKALRVGLHTVLLDRLLPPARPPAENGGVAGAISGPATKALVARVTAPSRRRLLLDAALAAVGGPMAPLEGEDAWRCRAILRLDALAGALGVRRPSCVTRANLAAALVIFEWPGSLRKADCEPLLDHYYGSSWSGVLRWVRLLRRIPP